MMKALTTIFALALMAIGLAACEDDASVASRNLSKAADMFEIDRRVIFYNGITGGYMLVIEGRAPWGKCQPEMARVGKKRAGRLLDGREWNEMPGGHQ